MSSSDLTATVANLLAEHQGQRGALLPLLHALQQRLGCIPPEALPLLAAGLDRSRAELQGVIDHYPDFRQQALAAPRLRVCRAEACQAMGGERLWQAAEQGQGHVLEPVYCLGLCACAPAFEFDGVRHGRATPDSLRAALGAKG